MTIFVGIIVLKIKRVEIHEIQNLMSYLNDNWSSNHILSQNKKLFDWQYKKNNEYNFIVAKENKKIFGFQGYIPLNQYDIELNSKEIFLAMWMAKKKGSVGLGYNINKKLIEIANPNLTIVLGINESLLNFHKWQKYKIGYLDHHVLISNSIDRFSLINNYSKKKNNIKSPIIGVNFFKASKASDFSLIHNSLFEYQRPLKSKNYFINRYLNHPIYKYDIYFAIYESKIRSIVVTRVVEFKKSRAIRLVDYAGSNKDIYLLTENLYQLLEIKDAEYIDFYSHGINKDHFKKAGFINKDEIKDLIVPNYFEPFVRKNINISYAYKSNEKISNLRLFKGDGDQDRPSQQ